MVENANAYAGQSWPLNAQQEAIWLDQSLHPGLPLYNIGGTVEIDGALDVARLLEACRSALADAPALNIAVVPGPAMTAKPAGAVWRPAFRDFSGAEADARRWLETEFWRPFENLGETLYRCALARVRPDRHLLMICFQHLVGDGGTMLVVLKRIEEIFARGASAIGTNPAQVLGEADLSAPPPQAADYWQARFQGKPPFLFGNPRIVSGRSTLGRAQSIVADIPRESFIRLQAALGAMRSSPHRLALLLFAAALARRFGQSDLTIGMSLHGRDKGRRSDAGCLSRVLPFRVRLDPTQNVALALKSINTDLMADLRHRRFDWWRSARKLMCAPRENPVLDGWVNYMAGDPDIALGAARGIYRPVSTGFLGPLALTVCDFEGHDVGLRLDYDDRLVDRDTAQHLFGFVTVAFSNRDIVSLSLEDLGAQRSLPSPLWNDTAGPVDWPAAPLALTEQARKTPAAVALHHDHAGITYAQLEARANRLANLLRARGIGARDIVGLSLTRSPNMIVALYAILKAGAAYLPLDPTLPADRLAGMIADAQPGLILVEAASANRLSASLLDIDTAIAQSLDHPPTPPSVAIDSESPAYVLFTSGSTGRPKGVICTHAGLSNILCFMQGRFPLECGDRLIQKTPLSFDASIWEIFWPLGSGAQVLLPAPGQEKDPVDLAQACIAFGVTVLQLVPSTLRTLLDIGAFSDFPSLRLVLAGGEALPGPMAQEFRSRSAAALYNLYGPTEASIAATWQIVDRDYPGIVPIGRPLLNTQIFIVDDAFNETAIGAVGELCIAGRGLAAGYVANPTLTRERFRIATLGGAARRVYRTGDLAAWNASGQIEYHGRIDNQVKLRGFRIELEELESVLMSLPGIAQAAATLREVRPGDMRLIGYVVPAQGCALDDAALKTAMRRLLPEYMLPSHLVRLAAFPRNSSGKLDRKALPWPVQALREHAADTGDVEAGLRAIWLDVLQLESIGRDEDFFESGGYSLLALQLIVRINTAFECDLPLKMVFEYPTIAEFCEAMAERSAPPAGALPA